MSTILSVLATISVGILTYAQSALHNEIAAPKIYKANSDRFYQRASDKTHCCNAFFNARCNGSMQQLDCGTFKIVNAPLLDFSVKSIVHIGKKILFFPLSKQKIDLFGEPLLVSKVDESFRLILFLPSEFIVSSGEYRIIAEYTDVWGKKYREKTPLFVDENTWFTKKRKTIVSKEKCKIKKNEEKIRDTMKKRKMELSDYIGKPWIWIAAVGFFLLIVDVAFRTSASVDQLVPAWTADGFLSFIGAITLGYIAFWQNKRYKELSDKATDLALMPEIYIANATSEKIQSLGKLSINRVSIKTENIGDTPTCYFSIPTILVIKTPIINICFTRLMISGREYNLVSEPLSIYNDTEQFALSINVPKEDYDDSEGFNIECTYENLYGTKYKKTIKHLKTKNTDNNQRWIFERSERA